MRTENQSTPFNPIGMEDYFSLGLHSVLGRLWLCEDRCKKGMLQLICVFDPHNSLVAVVLFQSVRIDIELDWLNGNIPRTLVPWRNEQRCYVPLATTLNHRWMAGIPISAPQQKLNKWVLATFYTHISGQEWLGMQTSFTNIHWPVFYYSDVIGAPKWDPPKHQYRRNISNWDIPHYINIH